MDPDGGIVVCRDPVGNVGAPDRRGIGKPHVGVIPGPGMPERIGEAADGRRVIGYLGKGSDVIGDGTAPKEADGRQHDIIIGIVRRGGRRLSRLGIGEPGDRHHRDRRHPFFFFAVGRIIGTGKQSRPIRAAAIRIGANLETAAERGQSGKIGMAGAAWLPGLARKARQCLCRRCVPKRKEPSEKDNRRRQQAARPQSTPESPAIA